MSYLSQLAARLGVTPTWLYEFQRFGQVTRLARWPFDYVDSEGVTWAAGNISHTKFRLTRFINRESTELVFPQSDAFARGYLDDYDYAPNELTIWHEFRGEDPPARVAKFRGRVVGTKRRFTRLVLMCENRFTEGRHKALPAVMQRACRHAHYFASPDQQGCRLNIDDFMVPGTMSALSDGVAIVSAASAFPDGHYANGFFRWNGRLQVIKSHVGDQLTLLGPVLGLAEELASSGTVAIETARGCDLSKSETTGCKSFGNLPNFGGFDEMDEDDDATGVIW